MCFVSTEMKPPFSSVWMGIMSLVKYSTIAPVISFHLSLVLSYDAPAWNTMHGVTPVWFLEPLCVLSHHDHGHAILFIYFFFSSKWWNRLLVFLLSAITMQHQSFCNTIVSSVLAILKQNQFQIMEFLFPWPTRSPFLVLTLHSSL